jgi:hypothetical protein
VIGTEQDMSALRGHSFQFGRLRGSAERDLVR